MVAQPDEHRRDRADQRDGALAEDAVRVVLRLVAKLARQQFADGVGIADREGVEGVTVLQAGGDHEVQHPHVILATEAAGECHHLAEQVAVRLAVHQHEARSLRERVGQQAQDSRRLAGAGRAGNGDVLPCVFGGYPKLLAGDAPADEKGTVRRLGLA